MFKSQRDLQRAAPKKGAVMRDKRWILGQIQLPRSVRRPTRRRLWSPALLFLAMTVLAPSVSYAKYASIVINAKTGEILHGTNIDTRNYPASLTKMMTLFMVFEALDAKKWTLRKRLKVSRRAARQPASRLGLRAGQTISVEEAVLALITKSANDVAVIVAENMHKTEQKFALAMTALARQIGMSRTTFRNASGLPHRGQMSTARDMARLAQVLIHRHGEYYHYFSRTHFSYAGRKHRNHNKLLTTYEGADGIKTGYIRAAGFNLVASAKRRNARIIGVIFGGNSPKHRNRLMTRILNKGFRTIGAGAPAKPRIAAKPPPPRKKNRVAAKPAATPPAEKPNGKWGIQVGAYNRYAQAHDSARIAINLAPSHLKDGVIRIVPLKTRRGGTLYRSRIHGLGKRKAYAACRVLERNSRPCMELRVKSGVQFASAEMR